MNLSQCRAKVWNRHTAPHKEEFRGDPVLIPPGGFVEMNYLDAMQFKGQHTPIIRDGLGRDLHPKRIEVELIKPTTAPAVEAKTFPCAGCGTVFQTQDSLDNHTAEQHLDQVVDDEAREKLAKRKRV